MKELDRIERKQLIDDFAEVINKRSIENLSNTPDFMIAEYLVRCLENWNRTVVERNDWFFRNSGETGKLESWVINPMEPNSKVI